MAKVKFPFYSMSASGTLITHNTSPPRGRKRRTFTLRRPPTAAEDIQKGPLAGAIVYQKNGTVTRSS